MILLKLNESNASLRVVPLPSLLSASAATTPATNESGRTFTFSIGGVYYGSGGSLSAVSAACGMYTCNFSASKISVTGPGAVYYGGAGSSDTCLAVSAPFMVVPIDSYDSMRLGLFALPNAAAEASGGLITHGTGTGQLHTSSGSVGLKAGTHSEVTIQGVTRVNSGVTLNANTHSGATIQGLSNYANISNVTLHAGTHSGATIAGIVDGGIVASTLASGVITSAKFAASAIDAAALATDAGQEIADRILLRSIEGGADSGRSVGQALAPLRNRVLIEGSVGTVYRADDTASYWTFSATTSEFPINSVDPTG